jgi:hypothetical protein
MDMLHYREQHRERRSLRAGVLMETMVRVGEFVSTDLELRAKFSSDPVTLEDGLALLQLLQALVEALQQEVKRQLGDAVTLLPVLSVRSGSIEVKIEMKIDPESKGFKAKVKNIFLAVLLAFGMSGETAVVGPPVNVPAVVASIDCVHQIDEAAGKAIESWKYFGKGFKGQFEGKCGDTTIKTTIEVPSKTKGKS